MNNHIDHSKNVLLFSVIIQKLSVLDPKCMQSWGPIYKESYDVSYDSRKIVTNLS